MQAVLKKGSHLIGTMARVFGDAAENLAKELHVDTDHEVMVFRPQSPPDWASHRSVMQSPGKTVDGVKIVSLIGRRRAIVKGDKIFFLRDDHKALVEHQES